MRQLTTLTLAAVALAACQTSGEGPITLSSYATGGYLQYLEKDSSQKAFAVSQDGRAYGWASCDSNTTICSGSPASVAISSCEDDARQLKLTNQPCYVLANRNNVVWRGALTIPQIDPPAYYYVKRPPNTPGSRPSEPVGAVLFISGRLPDIDTPFGDGNIPPYVRTLAAAGWDVVRGSHERREIRGARAQQAAADGIRDRVAELRRMGYQRVVVAAHSFGAWPSLIAGADGLIRADANIITTPIALDGPDDEQLDFEPVLRNLATPTLFFFDGQADSRDRARQTRTVLAATGVLHHVVDQPDNLSDHQAPWHPAFDFAFDHCIAQFAMTPTTALDCAPAAPSPDDHRWMTSEQDLKDASVPLAADREIRDFVGRRVVGQRPNGEPTSYHLVAEDRLTATVRRKGFERNFQVATTISNSALCLNDDCYRIYRWDDDTIIAVDSTGQIDFRGTVATR